MFPFRDIAAGGADVQVFGGNSTATGNGWATWRKKQGCTMAFMIAIGAGGNGGNGVVGANSTAAGGGGGGSGSMATVVMPLFFLPDELFITVGYGGSGARSQVCVSPDVTTNDVILATNVGGNGGNGSGSTGGSAGGAGGAFGITTSPLCGTGAFTFTAGQAGATGGGVASGTGVTVPSTGLPVTGGSGGGGLAGAGGTGSDGGPINGAGQIPSLPRGLGGASTTSPAGVGSNGLVLPNRWFMLGGTGGGASHGSATGAGLFGGNGGAGAPGCGGGGGGGCLTGGTAGTGGRGGDGIVVICQW